MHFAVELGDNCSFYFLFVLYRDDAERVVLFNFVCVCAIMFLLLCAALVGALRAHGPSSAAVAEQGLWAVVNLAAGNAANTTLLAEAGVCPGEC